MFSVRVVRVLAVLLLAACTAHAADVADGAADVAVTGGVEDAYDNVGAVDLAALLCEYNDGIEGALVAVESLRVEQMIFEPQADGSTKRARAVLSYSREGGMEREVTLSGVSHLLGRYTLMSLVGPVVDTADYAVEYLGVEEKEDHACHRVALEATTRDADHFDGTIWISVETPGPVRIIGTVADPPFPAVKVTLDKAFLPGPGGIWFVRRHTGEAEVKLLVTRHGTRHIFYDAYEVRLNDEAAGVGTPDDDALDSSTSVPDPLDPGSPALGPRDPASHDDN